MCARPHVERDVVWPTMSVSHSVFCVGRIKWVLLSASATQNRVRNLMVGPNNVYSKLATGRRQHRRQHSVGALQAPQTWFNVIVLVDPWPSYCQGCPL